MVSSPRATGPARNLLRQGSSTGGSLHRCRATCSTVVSSTGCSVGTLLHRGTPWAAGGHPASPWSSPQAAGDFCSGAWSTSPPPSTLTLAPARLFLTPLTLPAAVAQQFFPVLNMLSQRRKTTSLIGSDLEKNGALPKHGAASRSFSQKPPLWPPATKTLPCKPTTPMPLGLFPSRALLCLAQLSSALLCSPVLC